MAMPGSHTGSTSANCCRAALGVVLLGLAGCQSATRTQPGVIPPTRPGFGETISNGEAGLVPDWLRLRPASGTLLSPDETYLRDFAKDIAAPDNEKIIPWRRPIYMTGLKVKLGPPAAPEQDYYFARLLKWHASEEAQVNVLLADLHRANARLSNYCIVADRVLDMEEQRMLAISESDLISSRTSELEELVAHSIGNRQVIGFALQSLPGRIDSYAYAAKRARINLPGSSDHFNVDAQIASLAHNYAGLKARVDVLDQQITDFLSQTDQDD